MFGGGSTKAWTPDALINHARFNLFWAIRAGRPDGAAQYARQLMRLLILHGRV